MNNSNINCLLWADDLLLISRTPSGLQNSINKMHEFYQSMDLDVNVKKTKVMIFNKRGLKMDKKCSFNLGDKNIEITDEYQYLGIKLRPSGSFSLAVQELNDKACRAWFGISNIIFKNKRMEVDKIFSLFDSLVTPVATYGSPLWLPFIIKNKSFENKNDFLNTWEVFKSEIINQKCSKMVLSVKKTTSRLAVLGELGRYPLFIPSLAHCLNYKLSLLSRRSSDKLLGHALIEMENLKNKNCESWLTRVNKIENLLNIPKTLFYNKVSGKKLLVILKSKFDSIFLAKINEAKISSSDQVNHNKLRTYNSLKSSFTREPYIDLVRNRNQRCFLSRLRVSSHNLRVELGRYTRPITPLTQRTCLYCRPPGPSSPAPCQAAPGATTGAGQAPIDDEFHFIIECSMFFNERNCLYNSFVSRNFYFSSLTNTEKFKTLLCPVDAFGAKLVNRFIRNMFKKREIYDELNSGHPLGRND